MEQNKLPLIGFLLPTDDVRDGMLMMRIKEFYTPRNSDSCATKSITPELYIQTKHMGFSRDTIQPQHLYICSSEDIKEDDRYIAFGSGFGYGQVLKASDDHRYPNEYAKSLCKKIEFTTDPKLIAEGVPKIPKTMRVHVAYSDGTGDNIDVYFLTEFCKRWNDKGEKKLSDEKIGQLLDFSMENRGKRVTMEMMEKEKRVDVEELAEKIRFDKKTKLTRMNSPWDC